MEGIWMDRQMNEFFVSRHRKWIVFVIGQLSYKSIEAIEVMQSNLIIL